MVYYRGFSVAQMRKAHLMQTKLAEVNLKVGQGQNIDVRIQYRPHNSWANQMTLPSSDNILGYSPRIL